MMNVTQFMGKIYSNHLKNKGTKPSSIDEYRHTVRHVVEVLGNVALDEITTASLKTMCAELLQRPGKYKGTRLSPNTVRKDFRNIRAILRHAHKLGMIDSVPEIPFPKERLRKAKGAFSVDEMKRIIEATEGRSHIRVYGMNAGFWWKNYLSFLYNTGIRVMTGVLIEWDWIDRENRVITLEERDGVKTTYEFLINDAAARIIDVMRRSHDHPDYVFPWPMSERHLHRQFRMILRDAGVSTQDGVAFSGIRACFASEMAKESVVAASAGLGHSDHRVTEKYYINQETVARKAVEQLPEI